MNKTNSVISRFVCKQGGLMLLNDECRCQSQECDKKESCLRYIERNNRSFRTPSVGQMCIKEKVYFIEVDK